MNSGKFKNSTGIVLMTDFKRNMVKIKGLNLRKIVDEDGNTKLIEKKIHYSNCQLVDPVLGKMTKVGLTFEEEGHPIRISKVSGNVIPWPESTAKGDLDPAKHPEGPKDTTPEQALRKTYDYRNDAEAIRLARLAMTKYNRR